MQRKGVSERRRCGLYSLMIYTFSAESKIRLDFLLRQKLPAAVKSGGFSNSKIRRLIIAGAVSVNGREIRRPAYEVLPGGNVAVDFEEERFFYEKKPDDIQFELSEKNVLFEDEFLILVNKPAFFPVEKTVIGPQKRDCLHDALVRWLWSRSPSLRNPPYVGIMHRLDRGTSGVILFTKQRCVNAAVHDLFESGTIEKTYYALCRGKNGGRVRKPRFTVESYIGRISPRSAPCKWGAVSESKGGLYSKTEFSLLGETVVSGEKCSAVEARLFTGRTHQIRVHLSGSGFPVVGDELYGGIPAERLMLHSSCLSFVHPVTQVRLRIEAPCDFLPSALTQSARV